MRLIKPIIQVNGRPLRRAYVEHLGLGVGGEMYITDLEGRVRDKDGNEGIESLTDNVDIRVICQNPLVRILDGDNLAIGVYQDRNGARTVRDGDVVNLDVNREQDDYYAILNRIHLAYETAFQPLAFFQSLPNRVYPFGRLPSLRDTRDQARRVDLIYPDYSVAQVSWVEPKRLGDNFPLMHMKGRASDGRLFGEDHDSDGVRSAPTLIPHEFTHALHFTFLDEPQRGRAQDKYAEYITTDWITRGDARHELGERTTAEVAYIEAGGVFGQQFMEFTRRRQDGNSTLVRAEAPESIVNTYPQFVAAQWRQFTGVPLWDNLVAHPTTPIAGGTKTTPVVPADLLPNFPRRPRFTGGDVEGAVYGAIFADFAGTVGLDLAASAYFGANAITFGEYYNFITTAHPAHAPTIEKVRDRWRL